MALLSQFLPKEAVAAMSDHEVEILAEHIHTEALSTILTNQQVKREIVSSLEPLLPVVKAAHGVAKPGA